MVIVPNRRSAHESQVYPATSVSASFVSVTPPTHSLHQPLSVSVSWLDDVSSHWIRLGSNPSLAVPIDHETFRYPTDIASPTAGVRLIDDTCAPITTRKLWSNGNSVKSARLSLARSREITFDRSTTTSHGIDKQTEKEDNFAEIGYGRGAPCIGATIQGSLQLENLKIWGV